MRATSAHPGRAALQDDGRQRPEAMVDGGLDVRSLPVGAPGAAPFASRSSSLRIPASVKPGLYELFVSIGSAIGTPAIALPHDGEDGARRYALGRIRVSAPS